MAGPATGNAANQSLAEATVPPGGATAEHFHRTTEEIYLFTHGSGRMRLGDEEREVAAGDTVVIAPGVPHKLWNTGRAAAAAVLPARPPTRDEDTVLTESSAVLHFLKRCSSPASTTARAEASTATSSRRSATRRWSS